jgi:hypothetical protein
MIQQSADGIPAEHHKLYQNYLARVKSLTKVSTIMWVVLTYGNRIEMVDKELHMTRVKKFLKSGDDVKAKVAIEVMLRTLGEWRNR